jgi:hypothetical protein
MTVGVENYGLKELFYTFAKVYIFISWLLNRARKQEQSKTYSSACAICAKLWFCIVKFDVNCNMCSILINMSATRTTRTTTKQNLNPRYMYVPTHSVENCPKNGIFRDFLKSKKSRPHPETRNTRPPVSLLLCDNLKNRMFLQNFFSWPYFGNL